MSKVVDFGKVKVGRLYINSNDNVVRVVKVNTTLNNVIVYNYHSHTNQIVDLDSADKLLTQVFKLAEVARAVGKKPTTIRKYEANGLIPKARKIATNPEGKAQTRIYSLEDVEQLKLFFEKRRPVGRPSMDRSKEYSREEVKNKLDQIKMKEKLNG